LGDEAGLEACFPGGSPAVWPLNVEELMMEQCSDVIDAVQETLVLAFAVADKTVLDAPDTVQKILNSSKITDAIKRAAQAQAKSLMEQQRSGKPVSADDVKSGATNVVKAAGEAAKQVAVSQLEQAAKRTKEFKKLDFSIKELECAWKKSAIGTFVDKNQGLLIIVGSGLALGGAAAMYKFRAGDAVAGPATDALKKLVKFSILGNVEISAGEIEFKPSERLVRTKMLATANWTRVKAKFEADVHLQEVDLTQAAGKAEVEIKVFKDLTAKVHGSYAYLPGNAAAQQQTNVHQYDLGLGLSYANNFGKSKVTVSTLMFGTQDAVTTKVGGKVSAGLTLAGGGPKDPSTLRIEASAGATHVLDNLPGPPGRALPQSEWNAKLGVAWDF
jgi:hypothetical protein